MRILTLLKIIPTSGKPDIPVKNTIFANGQTHHTPYAEAIMTGKEYTNQINKVIDYIHSHLDEPLPVKGLCSLANLSPYHFHRIFTARTGEPLAKYVTRRRLERSASLLLGSPETPVSNIAFECGFSSASLFCRNFKRHFNMTAEEYRHKNSQSNSKNSQPDSNKSTGTRSYTRYFCTRKTIITGDKTMECNFEIKKLPAFNIIYCRHQGAYDQMQDAFARLMQWAYPRGLATAPGVKLLSVYHDNPDVTQKDKLISDAAMIVNEKIKTDGEIGQYEIAGGLYAVGSFELDMPDFPEAWRTVFSLIAEHKCQCTNAPHYEIYLNNREDHPQKKWFVDICIPVEMK